VRRDCVPTWIDENMRQMPLRRIRLREREFAESFLQELLHARPELLPIEEVNSDFGPLVSLGREIAAIDNLFIDPSGKITIVETKLWRNPQAVREVLAQILDYANRVSAWSYGRLEENCRRANPPAPIGEGSLYSLVKGAFPEETPDETEFIDSVERSLRTGRFLLLIVGDGIREGLEDLLGALHTQPNLLFTFGLVELQVFENPSSPGGRLIVPQVLAHSTEIVRAVVRIETIGQADVTVEIGNTGDADSPSKRRRKLSEDEFFELVPKDCTDAISEIIDTARNLGAIIQPRASSLSVRIPDPSGSKQKLTLFLINRSGQLYTGWLSEQLEKIGLDKAIASDWIGGLADLVPGVEPHPTYPDNLSRFIHVNELKPMLEEFKRRLKRTIDAINNPRQ